MKQANLIRVNLAERSYDIEIGHENIADAGRFLTDRAKATHVVLITDENVYQPHAQHVAESLGSRDIEVDIIRVEPGEASKSLDVAAALWQGMLDLGADRKSVVAAVGGGVVGDLAGFVAATFARGLRFLQVPTSLLAQVDSSVGGKVAIDLPEAKNMVGAFWQPLGVLIDTDVLETLPDREFRNGLAEVVKYGAILDAELFAYLETNAAAVLAHDPAVLSHVIARCCRLKADVVEQDEHEETGLRAILNYGHTFGHAFEMLSLRSEMHEAVDEGEEIAKCKLQNANCKIANSELQSPIANPPSLLHGEAVSIGMICAARLAERLGRVDAAYVSRLRLLLERFGLPVAVPSHESQEIFDCMMHDKKVAHGRLRFILPTVMGHVELVGDVEKEDILAAI